MKIIYLFCVIPNVFMIQILGNAASGRNNTYIMKC